jgi:hypothetical protein
VFTAHLQENLSVSAALTTTPIIFADIVVFPSSGFRGLGQRPHRPVVGADHSVITRNSSIILVQ